MIAPGVMYLSVLPIAFGILIAVICIRAISITITRPRGGVDRPSCEKCRYPVSGLASLNCPECGTDLRRTGIITRPMEMRRRGGIFGAVLGWTFLCLCVFGLFGAGAFLRVPTPAPIGVQVGPPLYTTALKPRSGAYPTLLIENPESLTTSPASGQTYAVALEVTLADGSQHRLEVGHDRQCTALNAGVVVEPTGRFSRETVAAWFKTLGLDSDDIAIAAELEEVVEVIDSHLSSGAFGQAALPVTRFEVGKSTSTNAAFVPQQPIDASANRMRIMGVAVLSGGVLVWVLGVVGIVLRRRALLREADAQPA